MTMEARSEETRNVKEIMMDQLQAGAGNSKKNRKLRLFINPPSIPTRYQTIYFDDQEKKAFNSTSRRFGAKQSDLPGPGYYAKAAESLENSVSISKKGFGVGFASKGRRFKNTFGSIDMTSDVSPAKYNPSVLKPVNYLHSSPAFCKPLHYSINAPVGSLVRTKTGFKATPGPGEYKAEKLPKQQHTMAARSAFVSKTTRNNAFPVKGSTPLGISSSVSEPSKKVTLVTHELIPPQPTSSFKASSRRSLEKKIIGPSIGQYDLTEKKHTKKVRPRIKIGSIAGKPPKSKEPVSIQSAIPGSGMTPIAFPSPGAYDSAKSADAIYRIKPAPTISKAERFKELKSSAPGPGHYRPIVNGAHYSFHLNLGTTWT